MKNVVDEFHREFYESGAWRGTRWLGVPVLKNPCDLWVYQEIIARLHPALIIECGTAMGGGAYFFASLCDLLGEGQVVTIDSVPAPNQRPPHPRVTYLTGSSTSPEVVRAAHALATGKKSVMVVLDSDHRRAHVAAELTAYAPLVTPGSYLVVEDTNLSAVLPEFGPGPMEAVNAFLANNSQFTRDASQERFLLTFNPGGYLRRNEE